MAFKLIQTIELTTTTSTVEFLSIPQDGLDLILMFDGRAASSNTDIRLNAVATGYNGIRLQGDSGNVNQSYTANRDGFDSLTGSSGSTANTFGNSIFRLCNYAGTAAKSGWVDSVNENQGTNAQIRMAAYSINTGAVTSLQIVGASFVAGSVFSLYYTTA